ncbi:MAG: hypothetical protein IOD12_03755 [Silvanigrellales bacterium]|jgi:hypothetical protein|nr:hypothetical protein [Silvanigrellales bacterium]
MIRVTSALLVCALFSFMVETGQRRALAQALQAPVLVFDALAFCAKKPSLGALIKEVFPDAFKRQTLASSLLSKPSQLAGCSEPLGEALSELASGKPSSVVKENRVGFLLLGAETKHPALAPALEAAMAAERGAPEWVALLLEANQEAGVAALRTWFASTARGLRASQRLVPLAADLYGKAASAPDSKGLDDVRLTSPLLFDLYLLELRKATARGKRLSDDDMASLLIVYALQNAGSRRLQQAPFSQVVRGNEEAFLKAFRMEHPLVQFRLLPTMAEAKSQSLVRELLWIASHHVDIRVKSLASSLLDGGGAGSSQAR